MPIWEMNCGDCGINFEALILTREHEALLDCPRCHSKHLERLPSTFSSAIRAPKHGYYRGPCSNPYENFTLRHVRDRDGKPLTVHSYAELKRKEKELGFIHAASNDDDIGEPPQNEVTAGDIRRNYKWKWSPPASRDDKVGVSVGVASDRAGTLIDLPDSTKEIPT